VNLLSNAVKYGAKNDNILVSIERSGEYARVNVTDHGQGVPIAEQHHIFHRYAQLNNAATVHIKGTGLGLSITKSLIEAKGGQVGFDTTEGQGSTFYILLPIA